MARSKTISVEEILCGIAVICVTGVVIGNLKVSLASDKPLLGDSTNIASVSRSSKNASEASTLQVIDKGYVWPVPSKLNISSGFGERIINGKREYHKGIDIGGKGEFGAPVVAIDKGEVTLSSVGSNGGYGNVIFIKHPDGTESRYAHNQKLLVQTGDKVEKGQQIAELGSTGRSFGPHLHFEIRIDGAPVDPLQFLPDYKDVPTEPIYKAVVTDDVMDLNIRRTISYTNSYNIIDIVPKGTELEVLREDNSPRVLDKSIYVLVKTPDGKIGYCKKSYIQKI